MTAGIQFEASTPENVAKAWAFAMTTFEDIVARSYGVENNAPAYEVTVAEDGKSATIRIELPGSGQMFVATIEEITPSA